MSATVRRQHAEDFESPYAKALGALIAEWRATGRCSQSDKSLIRALADKVSPAVRSYYLKGLKEKLSEPTHRGGELFENVIYLINRRRKWTAASLYEELKEQGFEVDEKALRNCINYLARTGRLRRIARGQYVAAGFGLVTSDPMPEFDIPKGGENED